MDMVALKSDLCCDALVIPGTVVDRMIMEANEAQLKIYLYLLKMGSDKDVTISSLADYFNYTEADVIRALRFWNGTEAKNDETEAKKNEKGGNVVAFSSRPSYSKDQIVEFSSRQDVSQLLFASEQYMGRPLTTDDISLFLYLYEEKGFSAELIEYLIEYCISNNKKSARSIENVASDWKDMGVATLDDAKRLTRQVPTVMPEIFDAFGIDKNRQPIDAEITYVRKWTESYGYSMEIIREACKRTIMSTGKPSFRYANSILKGWHEANVMSIADIVAADEQYRIDKANGVKTESKTTSINSKKSDLSSNANNKFRNFKEREYDYDALMKDIITN